MANYRAFLADSRWVPVWFPLFANCGGDFYVIDLNQGEFGTIWHFRIDEEEHAVEFASIGAMVSTLVESFARGTFFVDSSRYLEMDYNSFAAVAAELNPRIP
ncbi:hypothetical protein [Arthrobacter sp. 35W]|uniref:hypothetical protein n=1 Tax=Arthrobacter sp. 35W TaxID=1132441 RepID=UPI000558CE95|nr:hypothetical protein [Arthrobacter sp. 35W]